MLNISWEQIRKHYKVKKKYRSDETYFLYQFRKVEKFFKDRDFNEDGVDDYFMWLEDDFRARNGRDISGSYYNKSLAMIKLIGRKLAVGFTEEYDQMAAVYEETETLTRDEWERLLAVDLEYRVNQYSTDDGYKNRMYKLAILAMLVTTCRPGNILSLEWPALVNNVLSIRITKNGKPHRARLNAVVADQLRELRTMRDFSFIFSLTGKMMDLDTFNDDLKVRLKKAGILKNITAKSLRPTGITAYLRKYNIQDVAKISGHKSIDVMYEHYYRPLEDEIQEMVDNNSFMPEEPTEADVLADMRKLEDKYRGSRFMPILDTSNEKLAVLRVVLR